MILSENAPTLCPRCVHFTKRIDVGCRVGNYGLDSPDLAVQQWLREQDDESSWIYRGACPRFVYNGSTTYLMSQRTRAQFQKLLRLGR